MAMTWIRKANRSLARQVKEQESSYDPANIQGSKEDLDMKNKVLVVGASGLIGVGRG